MRDKFERKLNQLNEDLTTMGNTVAERISLSVTSLLKKDINLAQTIASGDDEIDQMEKSIEHSALTLILKQQPVASDLRFISMALKVVTDLERIGDQAADIAALVIDLARANYSSDALGKITCMSEEAVSMVQDSIRAFITGDLTLADNIIKRDDIVDNYFIEIRNDIVEVLKKDEDDPTMLVDFLFLIKYLERIADHAVNVAEWVDFSIHGELFKDVPSE